MRTRPNARSRPLSEAIRVPRPSRRSGGEEGEGGFTIAEMAVTLLVTSIIIVLAFGFVTNLLQQATNVRDTMQGVQQDQTAGEGLLQFLHSAIDVLSGSNATTLNASILAGVSSETPGTATFSAQLTNSASPNLDAVFSTTVTPCPVSASTCSTPRTIDDYDAVNSSAVFTYYYNNYSVTPVVLASTNTPTNAELSEIVAVGVDVTFLAGPHVPIEGFQAVRPSNFQTTVYLQNAAGAPSPTTTTTLSYSPTSPLANSPLTVTATVASGTAFPDGGTVNFTVSTGGSALSVCTSAAQVSTSNGQATCTFTPLTSGAYIVSATFSGTDDFQPSTSPPTTIDVLTPTVTTVVESETNQGGTSRTLILTATVSPSTATGTVTFSVVVSGTTYGGTVTLSSGTAQWSQSSLHSGNSWNSASAAYSGNSTLFYASSTGTPTPSSGTL